VIGITGRSLRSLLTGVLLATASAAAAEAQDPHKIPRVSVLTPGTAEGNPWTHEAFRRGMADLGYVEGRDYLFDLRPWGGDRDVLVAVLNELVRSKVDVIIAAGVQPIRAARAATSNIPIVMTAVSDPVGNGLVASLAHPGGNITGLTVLSRELASKRLELLKEAFPAAARIAILQNPDNAGHSPTVRDLEGAARSLGLTVQVFNARSAEDLEPAMADIVKWRAEAGLVLDDGLFVSHRAMLVTLATARRLPLACGFREMTEAGCLLSYSVDLRAINYRAAAYVDKILKGADPAELPIEQPTKFEFTVNATAARGLSVEIPRALLARADEVIE
jgi:putative ABC transport system substrate-binding protein